jgi:hypothetical protein
MRSTRDDPRAQTDARIQTPQEARDGVGGYAEFERGHPPTWAEYASELPHGGRGIVHVAQEIGEGHMIERLVGEREPFTLGAHEGTTSRGARRQHVGALIEANHPAATASDEGPGNHAGAGRNVEHSVIVPGTDGAHQGVSPARVLAQG